MSSDRRHDIEDQELTSALTDRLHRLGVPKGHEHLPVTYRRDMRGYVTLNELKNGALDFLGYDELAALPRCRKADLVYARLRNGMGRLVLDFHGITSQDLLRLDDLLLGDDRGKAVIEDEFRLLKLYLDEYGRPQESVMESRML